MENIDRMLQLAGLNEVMASTKSAVDSEDRNFTGLLPYDSPDNGYFPPQEHENGTISKRHKKWPQYNLYSLDNGSTWAALWASGFFPIPTNNGWISDVPLVDADQATNATLMPPNLVDTAGMRSKNKGLGYSNSPSMQTKRAMQFAQQMGLKNWDPQQGFMTTANYIPYALNLPQGKTVRVPVNLFSPAERSDIAVARWSGSMAPRISVGTYDLSREDEEDKDIVLGQPRKTAGGATDASGATDAGGVHAADAPPKTPVEKIKSIPVDPKVKTMQDELLAKDPNALPRFGADGKLGPETAAAMAKYPDIAKKYMSAPMITGMTIGTTLKNITKGAVDFGKSAVTGVSDFGKGVWKGLTTEDNNVVTFEEASYDSELARIKSLSLFK
jgi:hypothetical protein